MTSLRVLIASSLLAAASVAGAQDRPGPAFEDSWAQASRALAAAAAGGRLPVFGNRPPGTMTGAERDALVQALPADAGSLEGAPSDAVNLVFVGSEAQVKALLTEAGWIPVPKSVLGSVVAGVGAGLDWRSGKFPPFSPLYIDGRRQAMNWSLPVSLKSRHHFRLWDSALVDPRGRRVWPGAGIFDKTIVFRPSPDHVADPDVDAERGYVYSTLVGRAGVARMTLVPSARMPRRWTVHGQVRFTDGRVLVVELEP